MKNKIEEKTCVIIKNAKLVFPYVFEPHVFGDYEPRYKTAFEYEPKTLEKLGYYRDAKSGLYNTNSRFAPEINLINEKGDFSLIAKGLEIARARNMALNRLLSGAQAHIELSVFDYQTRDSSGVGAGIRKIWIDEKRFYEQCTKNRTFE